MPLLLSDRAQRVSPLPIHSRDEIRMLGVGLHPSPWGRIRKGLYVQRASYEKLPPWERYAVRVHAYLRTHPTAVLCLESAATMHGIPGFDEPKDIHVFDPDLPKTWRHADALTHTSVDPREIVVVSGIRVTSMSDTVVDLARVAQPAHALAMADAAISPAQGGGAVLGDLIERAEGQRNQRGRARMRWIFENADSRAESPTESVSRAVMLWSGFEKPDLQ